jgi:Tfp pilus assembly protein PilO
MNTILKKHIVTLVLSVVLPVALLIGGLLFIRQLTVKVSRIADIKERIASYQKNKKAFTDEVSKIQLLEKRVGLLESSVITAEEVPTLLSSLESLAKDSGVTFEITSVQNPVENDVPKLTIECSVIGSKTQILSFLDRLQHQSFAVGISKLFLFSEEGQQSSPVVAGVLSGGKTKAVAISPEKQWHGIATVDIISF